MTTAVVLGVGMQTAVGFDAPSSCAAMRCGLANAVETHFIDAQGEPVIAALVPFEEPLRGRQRLTAMAVATMAEALRHGSWRAAEVPLLLALPAADRPGLAEGLDAGFLETVTAATGCGRHPLSRVYADDRVGGVLALVAARDLVVSGQVPAALVLGIDCWATGGTIGFLQSQRRLRTGAHADGLTPGEAAAALLIGPMPTQGRHIAIVSSGIGQEEAVLDSGKPFKADGVVTAIRAALAEAKVTYADIAVRLSDANGEPIRFKEAALALARLGRGTPTEGSWELWHTADSLGDVGAALIPCAVAVFEAACRKGYAPGAHALCHVGDDDGRRAALILALREAHVP